jgi:hypothetical protein
VPFDLQELQSFYATYLAPSSPSRRKLCVQVIPAHKPPPGGGGGEGGEAPQDHVQHEFGVVHPGGEHHAKPTRKEDGGAPPDSKRARRQQQQPQQEEQDGGRGSVQVARVQAVSDVKAFAAGAEHYGVYQTVQPQLAAAAQ